MKDNFTVQKKVLMINEMVAKESFEVEAKMFP